MEIRLLTREELDQSLDLVWKVFCEYEAVNYTEDSRQIFYDAIHSKDYLDMLKLLHDEKPTVVRQSLNALKEIVVFRPELSKTIENELGKIDISGYKDSMIPLIKTC